MTPSRAARLLVPTLLSLACVASAAWAQPARRGGIARAEGGRSEVLIVTGDPLAHPEAVAALGRLVSACRAALGYSAEDSAAILLTPPPVIRFTAGDAWVRFLVLPAERIYSDCGDREVRTGLAAAHALRFGVDTALIGSRRVLSAQLVRADGSAVPAMLDPVEMAYLGRTGAIRLQQMGIQLTVRLDDLAAPPRSAMASLAVKVRSLTDTTVETVEVDARVLADVWEAALPARLERAGIPVPVASELSNGRDRARARAALAASLANSGDAIAARVLYEDALRAAPCLSTAADAPAAIRALDDIAMRPRARCTALPPATIAWRSLLIPGFGRPPVRSPRLGVGTLVPVGIGVLGAIGFSKDGNARDLYRKYLGANSLGTPPMDTANVGPMYVRANEMRMQSARYYQAAAALWLGSVALDLYLERRHSRHLRAERGAITIGAGRP